MGDPKTSSSSLPPGCRFYPSEQQIFNYYLSLKNENNNDPATSASDLNCYGFGVIRELNLYNYNPFDLPDTACFGFGFRGRAKHWYCYVKKIDSVEGKAKRRAGFGYWKRKRMVRDITSGHSSAKVVLGRRRCFVYYLDSKCFGDKKKRDVRTDLLMYEYTPIDHLKASFVLCRVFRKSRVGRNTSEHGLSSCAEESTAVVRHIGIQHNGSVVSDMGNVREDGINLVDRRENIPTGTPTGLIGERLIHPSDVQLNSLVRSPQLGLPLNDPVATLNPRDDLEGDFIELDDLMR